MKSEMDERHVAAFHERERMRAGDGKPACFEPRMDLHELVGKLTAELHRATTSNRNMCELLVNMAGELERALDGERIDREIAEMMIRSARGVKERCP